MKYVVDRIENDKVICENDETKQMEEFEKTMFPEEIKEGDIVVLENEKFEIQEEETQARKETIEELMRKLMKG